MKGFEGLLLGGGQVCVFQQGAAWLYSLMALTFIVGVCCGILKWAEPPESDPAEFSGDGLVIPGDLKVLSQKSSSFSPRCAAEAADY